MDDAALWPPPPGVCWAIAALQPLARHVAAFVAGPSGLVGFALCCRAVCREVARHCELTSRRAREVGDRAEAILRAVDMLGPGDGLLITGKGHETGQIIGQDVLPFNDAEQASVAVAALDGLIS